MKDVIILAGAPGSGKTTIGKTLQTELKCPLIDLGDLRIWHLDREWSNKSKEEEEMAFENLVFVVQNYLKHGYKNLILNDLHNDKIKALTEVFKDTDFVVISLILNDDSVLEKRVSGDRDSGFKNTAQALAWNEELKQIVFPHEFKIDNTSISAEEAAGQILEVIQK